MPEKSDRLGLRGRLTHFESALRLLGGANATGAIAAGAAFHAFDKNVDVQSWLKLSAVLFLFGIFTFVIAYITWFVTVLEIDQALYKDGEPEWPDDLFMRRPKTTDESKASAKNTFVVMVLVGLLSFIFFFTGFATVLMMAIGLHLGPG